MSGGDCTRPDGQAPGNPGHPAANSCVDFCLAQSSIRVARRSRRRLARGSALLALSFDGKLEPRTWKAGLKKPEIMLMEDNPLNANSET